jgi:hypothetical protein
LYLLSTCYVRVLVRVIPFLLCTKIITPQTVTFRRPFFVPGQKEKREWQHWRRTQVHQVSSYEVKVKQALSLKLVK